MRGAKGISSGANKVYIDPEKLLWHMQRLGLSKSAFADRVRISRNTINTMLRGEGVGRGTANALAQGLGVDVASLLRKATDGESVSQFALPGHPEWIVLRETIEPLSKTSSELFFHVCKLRHAHLHDEYGRGKLFDLLGVADPVRDDMKEKLTRHAQVCRSVPRNKHIADNVSVTAVENGDFWWVIDRWIESKPLSEHLASGAWPSSKLKALMTQIADALATLHEQDIVFRELAPVRVLIAQEDGRVVVTDLELAKLLKYGKTVASDWPIDPYRAAEVDEGEARPQADLYSWGRIFVHAATGQRPDDPGDAEVLKSLRLPKVVASVVERCLSPNWKKRPESATEILAALEEWC